MAQSTRKKKCTISGCRRVQHSSGLCWHHKMLEEDGELTVEAIDLRRAKLRRKKGELNPSQLLFLADRESGMMPPPAAKWFGSGGGGASRTQFRRGNSFGTRGENW